MDIKMVVTGILGALVAMLLRFVVERSKDPSEDNAKDTSYLAGLIPLFPTFMLLGHSMFAWNGNTKGLQDSALFGLLSLVPYATYLLLVWWFATGLNMWMAIGIGLAGWFLMAFIAIFLWNL